MKSGGKLKDAEKMKRRMSLLSTRMRDEVRAAFYIETEVEVKEAKRRTPVDTGSLRASIHQEGPTRNGRTLVTLIAAGGPAAPYALYVHENLEALHPVGQAKYIESVIMESIPHLAARIGRRIDLGRMG